MTGIVVQGWHGTTRRFSAFDPSRSESEYGCFFADTPEAAVVYANDEGGRIVHVDLHFLNPFRCDASEWLEGTCPDPKAVAAEGIHDGYVVDGLDGTTLIAWNQDTIDVKGDVYLHGSPEFDELRVVAIEKGYVEPDTEDPVADVLSTILRLRP